MSDPAHPADLVGAWELSSWRIDYSDGRPSAFPFGEDARGLLIYSADGHMSAGISRRTRSPLGGGSTRRADPAARASAFDSYFHYQGRYRVEEGAVIHEVSAALNPDFVGSRQRRDASLVADELELSARESLPGSTVHRTHRLRWRRAPAPVAQD